MALVKCPDCGKMISSRASVCPECGCPANFFVNLNQADETKIKDEGVEFIFNGCKVKYPCDTEKFAGLYGDYIKIGFEKYEELCAIYKRLGSADRVKDNFYNLAQKEVDGQITRILEELYSYGITMTMNQFKTRYSDYPMDYQCFMEPFEEKYDAIIGAQQRMADARAASYARRGRWVGGGFGMKGAIKGAMQAGILNAGTSMISGLGNAVIATANEGTIERKKEALFENNEVMVATCEGIMTCMNGLFLAYTNELEGIGKLGNRIPIEYETAEAKFQSAMQFEKDKTMLFKKVVECIALYPSSRTFYDAIEMELDACEDWKKFKEYWHLNFLYKEIESAIIKTDALMDGKKGILKLTQDVLLFEGENPKDSKSIPVGAIKKADTRGNNDFCISLKNKFLLICFETKSNDLWIKAINNAINGSYEKVNAQTITNSIAMKKEEKLKKDQEAREYILANYTVNQKTEAVKYYREYTGESLFEAKEIVDDILGIQKTKEMKITLAYPGTEDLKNGMFEENPTVLVSGEGNPGYLILTKKELIEIDTKKQKENRYDIYKMSHMKVGFLGLAFNFRYSGSFMEKSVGTWGTQASVFIEKIQQMQKGNF